MGGFERKLPKALRSRGTAVVIAVLMALIAVFGIGGIRLKGLVKQTERSFYEGENSIAVNISMRKDAAANLLTLLDQLPGSDFDSQREALEKALDGMKKTDRESPAVLSQADRDLQDAFFNAFEIAEDQARQEGKFDLMHRQKANFEAAGTRISRLAGQYNEQVEQTNKALKGFPASLLRLVWGVKEAEPCV